MFVYWTFNNIFLLGQFVAFSNPTMKKVFAILPAPPTPVEGPTGKPRRSGWKGFLLDRLDFMKLAWKNHIGDLEKRRSQINKMGLAGAIKYETKSNAKPDRKAKAAGKIEKL